MIRLTLILLLANICHGDPIWIANPPYGAVGVASKNSDSDTQMRLALISAKAELAKQKKIRIQSQNTLVDENFSSSSKQTSSELIHNITILDRYKAEDGTLYLWIK